MNYLAMKHLAMKHLALSVLAVSLAACDTPSSRVAQFQFGNSPTLATTGNLRLVTERSRLMQDGTRVPVVCTEPSPDYAIAFGRKISASGALKLPQVLGGAPAVLDASGNGEIDLKETLSELRGRSEAIMALRDGLYSACQAYANGVIGHDAYSIILSQYGSLLVALVGNKQPETSGNKGRDDGYGQSAKAALLVACVSAHDPTRFPAGDSSTGKNALLTIAFCRSVLASSVKR